MKRFRYIFSALLMAFPVVGFSLSDYEFQDLMSKIRAKDYGAVEQFLDTNKSKLSHNPEYYVVLLNYVISKGRHTGVAVATGAPKENDFGLHGKESGEAVGFIGPREKYDKQLIVDGLRKTENALTYFKSRLDIYFGMVVVAERIERWDIVGDLLIRVLETSREIDNKWTWGSINAMEGEPEEFMIQNIVSKTTTLFHAENQQADEIFIKVSKAMIEHYPNKVYGYANLGTMYLAKKEYEQAERYYKEALEIDPNDQVILGNLEELKRSRK